MCYQGRGEVSKPHPKFLMHWLRVKLPRILSGIFDNEVKIDIKSIRHNRIFQS